MKLVGNILRLVFRLAVALVAVVCWCIHLAFRGVLVAASFGRAKGRMRHGTLLCPNGHAVPAEGQTYECLACGFVYVGSIWLCPHCQAVTPFVACPECSLSVESPYRWGPP